MTGLKEIISAQLGAEWKGKYLRFYHEVYFGPDTNGHEDLPPSEKLLAIKASVVTHPNEVGAGRIIIHFPEHSVSIDPSGSFGLNIPGYTYFGSIRDFEKIRKLLPQGWRIIG